MGSGIRKVMKDAGLVSVAAEGYESPTVCVFYAKTPNVVASFAKAGL